MLQLLENEALVLERLKLGKNVHQIASEIGFTRNAVFHIIKRLIALGIVERSGGRRKYINKALDKPYEIVPSRPRPKAEFNLEKDALLRDAMSVKLSDEELFYLRGHRKKLSRSTLAKKLGLTKLQLNFVLEKVR